MKKMIQSQRNRLLLRNMRVFSQGRTKGSATPHPDNKPVFQMHPKGSPLSFQDLQEAYEVCRNIPKEHRDDCYSIFNVDGSAMDMYYRTASILEKQYQHAKEVAHKQKSFYFRIGPFHIYISRD